MENVNLKNESNNANTLLYADIKLGMDVTDELGRKGRIIANDDIDNIKEYLLVKDTQNIIL